MPIPFILAGAAVVAGAHGIKKGAEAHENNAHAKHINEEAQKLYSNSERKFKLAKSATTNSLNKLGKLKLELWGGQMKQFLTTFNSFKNVTFEDDVAINDTLKLKIQNTENLRNMQVASLKASEVLNAGVASLGAGALAGIASYGGAMMFASASTGTAIASLSGAAATNATMAWFGGGAIAAGGFGMHVGAFVLGGIAVGPIFAVAGSIMAAKSEENLANARATRAKAQHAAEQMNALRNFLWHVKDVSDDYYNFLTSYQNMFAPILAEMVRIQTERSNAMILNGRESHDHSMNCKIDYATLSLKEKKLLHLAWLMAQVEYTVLSAPLLTQKGNLDFDAKPTLTEAKESLPRFRETIAEIETLSDV